MSALDKAKELVKKTNAAVLVVNETTDEVFVVMTVDEYERLLNRDLGLRIKDLGREMASAKAVKPEAESRKPEAVVNTPIGSLTEEELLSKMSEQVREWRSAQVDREQIVLAEMPPEIKFKDQKGEERGKYNFAVGHDVQVNHLEDEERFFLDNLD